MKVRLPIIGLTISNERRDVAAVVDNIAGNDKENVSSKGKAFVDMLGAAFDFPTTNLSNEREISSRLLEANKEWVYRNNDVIAMEVSKIEFELYSVGLSKGEIVFNEITSHPLLDLLDKPNPETTKSDALYIIQSHKKLTGDAFWLKIRRGKQTVALRQLPPDKVKLNLRSPTPEDPTVIETFEYNDTINGEKVSATYQPEDIIHFKKPNPNNYFRGYGAVEALAETIDVDNLTNFTTKSFFKKGAITNFVLSTEQKLNDQQIKRFQATLKSMYGGGSRNAYNTMILGGGLKPEKLTMSNKDMEFLDQLAWYRDKIMVGFGNTPASLGIVEDVNRANAEATLISWKRNTIKPDMDSIVTALNEFLVPEFGKNLILGYTDPIPEDRTDDLDEATKLFSGGIIMRNEARELLGYESVTNGDVFQVGTMSLEEPGDINEADNDEAIDDEIEDIEDDEGEGSKSNKTTLRKRYYRKNKNKELPAALAHIDIKKLLRERGIYFKQRFNAEMKDIVRPIAKELVANGKAKHKLNRKVVKSDSTEVVEPPADEYQPPVHAKLTSEQIMDYHAKRMHSVDDVSERLEKALTDYLAFVKSKFLDKLDTEIEARKSANPKAKAFEDVHKDFFDEAEDDLTTQAQIDFAPLLDNLAAISGQRALDLVLTDNTYIVSDAMRKQIASNVSKFTSSMLDTDRDHLTNLITMGIENGESIAQIRDTITNDLDQYNKMQATRISRTEVLRASNQSAKDAWIQSGVVEGKQWITAGNPCDECEPYEQKIETLDGNFYDDTDEFSDGDPPLHPNCQCTLIPILVDEGTKKAIIERDADRERIKELESQLDKRKSEVKKMMKQGTEDKAYIKILENYLDDNAA